MTKPMNPEVKALRAMGRALRSMPLDAQARAVDFFHAGVHGTTQDRVRAAMRRAGLSVTDATAGAQEGE